ncbi:AbrB/MazE/SpoVT family DNA-binding domain-containing protein [Roseospira navarrensis]|uniref:AbrB/MazE/SpoVT family DNA-binding domain-containing protein n=1 Tax=Roseospira navarrensis TaxID=140058 RepID=A0A7X2D666_9PROT|nr:AbrB/MazE/SpoVT family DNA-binding domain-containing protein [Roseospira navarrensis]MQX38392.1 AbrB/MazE/SpoVT family DNA-binding domain-containing protein [Roseospira navarrensis]
MRTQRLTEVGNATGVTIPPDVLSAASMDRGDTVTVTARDGRIEIAKAADACSDTMEAGRAFIQRYPRTLRDLAQ